MIAGHGGDGGAFAPVEPDVYGCAADHSEDAPAFGATGLLDQTAPRCRPVPAAEVLPPASAGGWTISEWSPPSCASRDHGAGTSRHDRSRPWGTAGDSHRRRCTSRIDDVIAPIVRDRFGGRSPRTCCTGCGSPGSMRCWRKIAAISESARTRLSRARASLMPRAGAAGRSSARISRARHAAHDGGEERVVLVRGSHAPDFAFHAASVVTSPSGVMNAFAKVADLAVKRLVGSRSFGRYPSLRGRDSSDRRPPDGR